jgi:hypothetical protein
MSCVDADVPACGFIPVVHIPQAGAVPSHPSLRTFPDATMPAPFFRKLVQRIREEFEDAPNLRLTVSEAARFWALDFATCERILTELLRTGFLARGPDERFGQVALH